METVIALTGKDYVMVVADLSANRSIFNLVRDEDKIYMIDSTKFLAAGGDQASRTAFCEYITRNFALSKMRTEGLELTTHASAHFIRNTLAKAIRSRSGAYQAQSLLGGFDPEAGASLYHLDYLGSLAKVNHGVQGYASYFTTAVLDKYWKANMTLDEGRELIKLCLQQLETRYTIAAPEYKLVAVGADGKILDEVITAN